jgi:pilus assembly protein CpaB
MARAQELTLPGGNRTLLLIAIIAGAIAAAIVFVVVTNSDSGDSSSSVSGDAVPALVATQSIKAGQEITEDMVEVRQVPADLRISGAYDSPDLVVGEVSKIAISAGEQINSAKIGIPVPDKGLPGVVSSGMRGVAVEVDEVTAVGGNLLPGDRVDIVATTRIDGVPGLPEDAYVLRTETILQNVEVISVAQEAQEPTAGNKPAEGEGETTGDSASSTSGQIPDDVEGQPDANTLTLALTPEQALLVISRQEYSVRIWATVRAFGDDAIYEVAPVEVTIVDDGGLGINDFLN